jgi:HAD superfamily hydrolase (TIGR01509 family)
MMNQALLFDFNGVIVDDEAQHYEALQHVLAGEGIALSRESYWEEFLGFDDRMCFREAFRRAEQPLDDGALERLVAAKSREYEAMTASTLALVPGVTQFVTRAAERFRLGVVSGALRREIERALERAELLPLFEVLVSADEVAVCKPDPTGYRAAHAALQAGGAVPANRCVVIEDSLPGMLAARRAGMPCVMLTTSHPPHALREADLVWDSFAGHAPAELEALLTS